MLHTFWDAYTHRYFYYTSTTRSSKTADINWQFFFCSFAVGLKSILPKSFHLSKHVQLLTRVIYLRLGGGRYTVDALYNFGV